MAEPAVSANRLELLQIADAVAREKTIDKSIVLQAMEEAGASRPAISAVLGPTIAQSSYEVGPEFRARFIEADPNNAWFFIHSPREDHYMFDLPAYIGARLKANGVGRFENLALDTYADDKRFYMDFTGTGNSLNVRHPHSLQLIMDSLRYWVTEMHVDGFRFDLASSLAREFHEVDKLSTFFDLVQQDPVVSQAKLIAEPSALHGFFDSLRSELRGSGSLVSTIDDMLRWLAHLRADAGADNVYDVTVQVSDGTLTDSQAIAVTVTNVNDNDPVITSNGAGASASVSVAENQSAVTTVVATDADGDSITLEAGIDTVARIREIIRGYAPVRTVFSEQGRGDDGTDLGEERPGHRAHLIPGVRGRVWWPTR